MIEPAEGNGPVSCRDFQLRRLVGAWARIFNKIKLRRRIATRYDKLGANYLAFIKLAAIRI